MALLGTAFFPTALRFPSGWRRLVLSAVLLAVRPLAAAESPAAPEYQLKAAFLFNFTQFVEWPAVAFADAQAPFVIGVLGDDPFGAVLDETVRGETVGGRPLLVQRYRKAEDIKACHVLFISKSEAAGLERIVAALKDRNVLTVGDTEGFARRGVLVRLVTEDKKIRLHINADAAKAVGLVLSSKLLRLAELVTPGKD